MAVSGTVYLSLLCVTILNFYKLLQILFCTFVIKDSTADHEMSQRHIVVGSVVTIAYHSSSCG